MIKEIIILYKMDQVNNTIFNAVINIDENSVTFTQEQWRLVKIACKTYSAKLDCARRHYHKTKQLKGKRHIDEATPRMAITNEIASLEAKPINEICVIKHQADTNIKPEVCLIKNQANTNIPKRPVQSKQLKITRSNEEISFLMLIG